MNYIESFSPPRPILCNDKNDEIVGNGGKELFGPAGL